MAGLGDYGTKEEFFRVSVYRVREAFHSVSFGELHVPATRCHSVIV